jgi:deoxyadenosine/deoxycytidine kinase
LRTTPSTCIVRIAKRNRNGENEINENYIRSLHEHHEDWLMTTNNKLPVLVVDSEKDENSIDIEHIIEFVNTHTQNAF